MATKETRPIVTKPEPEQPPTVSAAHRDGCSCHKEVAGVACCGGGSVMLPGWHVDPCCPWRP